MFQGSQKDVSLKYHASFSDRKFQVSGVFQGRLKGVFRVLGISKDDSKKF